MGNCLQVVETRSIERAARKVEGDFNELVGAEGDSFKIAVAREKLSFAKRGYEIRLAKLAEKDIDIAQREIARAGSDRNKVDAAMEKRRRAESRYQRHMANIETLERPAVDNAQVHEQITPSPSMSALRHSTDALSPQLRNPWAMENGSSTIQFRSDKNKDRDLRAQVANHYRCKKKDTKNGKTVVLAKCCISQVVGDHNQVIAAHLLPRRSAPKLLESFNMASHPEGIDNYRNVVLLAKNIEAAFDRQRVCFVKNFETDKIVLEILDPSVESEPIFDGATSTIGEYRGKPMQFAQGTGPYTRVLSCHAAMSHAVAKENKWIPFDKDVPKEYLCGSPLREDVVLCLKYDFSMSGKSSNVSDLSIAENAETKPTVDSTQNSATHSSVPV